MRLSKLLENSEVQDYLNSGYELLNDIKDNNILDDLITFNIENPDDIDGCYYLGLFYFKYGRYDEALTILNKALSINDKDLSIYQLIGLVYFRLGKTEEAMDSFSTILKIDSSNYNAIYNMGYIHFQLNNYTKAITFLNKIVATGIDNSSIYHKLSIAYLNTNNLDLASKNIQIAINMDGNNLNIKSKFKRSIGHKKIVKIENSMGELFIPDFSKKEKNFNKDVNIIDSFTDNNLITSNLTIRDSDKAE